MRQSFVIDAQVVPMPCEAAELRSLYLVTASPHLDKPFLIVTPEILAERRALEVAVAGRPYMGAITSGGRELIVTPAPDASYTAEIIFFAALQPLSDTNTINNVLEEAPDAYLYGTLLQAEPYLEHDERIPVWKEKFDTAIDELNYVREREEHAASLQPVRLPVVF